MLQRFPDLVFRDIVFQDFVSPVFTSLSALIELVLSTIYPTIQPPTLLSEPWFSLHVVATHAPPPPISSTSRRYLLTPCLFIHPKAPRLDVVSSSWRPPGRRLVGSSWFSVPDVMKPSVKALSSRPSAPDRYRLEPTRPPALSVFPIRFVLVLLTPFALRGVATVSRSRRCCCCGMGFSRSLCTWVRCLLAWQPSSHLLDVNWEDCSRCSPSCPTRQHDKQRTASPAGRGGGLFASSHLASALQLTLPPSFPFCLIW